MRVPGACGGASWSASAAQSNAIHKHKQTDQTGRRRTDGVNISEASHERSSTANCTSTTELFEYPHVTYWENNIEQSTTPGSFYMKQTDKTDG